MKRSGILLFFWVSALYGNEEGCADQQDISCHEDFEISEEEPCYSRHYYCPHRYSDFYDYEDIEKEATWPGKIENHFMEELMH